MLIGKEYWVLFFLLTVSCADNAGSKSATHSATQEGEECALERDCSFTCPTGSSQQKVDSRVPDGRAQACVTNNGSRHGPVAEWYPSGQLARRGSYLNGKQDGMWDFWFDSGKKLQQGSFREGAPDGLWTYWHPLGAKAEEATFVGGKKNGPASLWDSDGIKSSVIYRDNQFLKQ